MNLRERVASALDYTHATAYRGPRTLNARNRLAIWLDTNKGTKGQVHQDCLWLETIATQKTEVAHAAT